MLRTRFLKELTSCTEKEIIYLFFTRKILFEKSSKTYSYINIYTDNIIYNIYTTYIPPPPIINTLFDVKIH